MSEPENLTVQILKEIRDEIVATRTDLGARLDQTNARLDQTNARLDQTNARLDQTNARLEGVEGALLDLAQQQRFMVRHQSALTERDRRLERDVDELRARVEVLEERVGPER
ncbi:MAG: hypothetical protein AB7S26_01670 [Sandaracinaceae bacterium]